jgi:release factor glutamine methyltransferase
MNVQQALAQASRLVNSDSAKVDAEILLSFVLDKNRTWLKTWPDYQLTKAQQTRYAELFARRENGEPIAYIVGERNFWTLTLKTNPSTLIPRPETELLVELSVLFLQRVTSAKVLDLGTGTGAIALAIASERPDDKVIGVDYNSQAVALATSNAIENQINNARFFQSHWYQAITDKDFDLIVSNPPYVAEGDAHLMQGDLVFEPASALVAAENGLADIKLIAAGAKKFLKPDGGLMIEHGFEQGEAVRAILSENGFVNIQTKQDLADLDRVTLGEMPC